MKKIYQNKNLIITSFFLLACLALYIKFPASGPFQFKAVSFTFLFLIPFFYFKLILKEEVIFKRIKFGEWKKNVIITAASIFIALLFIGLIFRFTNLLDHYPLSKAVKENFFSFLSYELFGTAFTVLLYEIFFRGFVLFYFEQFIGYWSILLQSLLFYLMLYIIHLPFAFSYLFILFVPFSGFIAFKTKSPLYSFIAHILFVIIADASAIALIARF